MFFNITSVCSVPPLVRVDKVTVQTPFSFENDQIAKTQVQSLYIENIYKLQLQEHQCGIPLVGLWPDLCCVITKLTGSGTMLFDIKKRKKSDLFRTEI